MSYRIESSVTIMAPPEVVWTTIQNVSRRLEWDARITSVELLTPPPIGKGARTFLKYRMLGMPLALTIEMITWQPPHKSAVKGSAGGKDSIAASWHLTPSADGSTTWTTKLVLKSQGRFAWLREQISGRATARLTILSQGNAKRLIEGEYSAAASGIASPAS